MEIVFESRIRVREGFLEMRSDWRADECVGVSQA